MFELSSVYQLVHHIFPFACLESRFMQQAMVGLLLLSPMTAAMGVQVVNFRMAFFADAISHSAFAGVAMGLILAWHPHIAMPIFGVLVGIWIMATQRRSRKLSSDTVIGVFFSAVVAFGLAVVSRDPNLSRDLQQFLYGDILTIADEDIFYMGLLFCILACFQVIGYNRMLYIGFDPMLAEVHRVRVAIYQYVFAALLSLVVILSVWAVGVLLVTAMLIVPAAAARNMARSAGSMFWWAIGIGLSSSISGLILSAQDWAQTATGATIILVAFGWFLASMAVARFGHNR
ncbi:metal ABC transporter permease [Desulfatirhabdium butyrativorans]|uniref:metal ABC transporter permease n=1 Tax=Desulfatirhabdium butyrativorans TaxID=340467 RepID=UPI0004189104|nr:metal ABC transporter permease [Desulfatirhabdium butyrativorans]